ncbi:NADH-ubiquinone reductase complex 1 MLRQ subunit-domain-containing protein [Leucosporidium creatinivorum]|uniref:NADH-ubiquinone reductase complex 1 MLRQ subunit-domain-containing protein n=1 Tax=Leucosporidium creatinivorum TaxID=106004 RepID=A0A1Y2G0T6_9BASI|nr:NADH-ubiquinone reductase complex 1 MLRQ subunit-domain-containing protein [Leucosporidium creatinivorum]
MFARTALRTSVRGFQSSARQQSAAAPGATKVKPSFWSIWYEPAAVPIYVTVGVACAGAGWYLTHLMRHPDVVWDRHNNPEPWNRVEQGTNTKLHSVNQVFERTYKRDKL